MREVNIPDTIRGKFRFDANQHAIIDIYFLLTEEVVGRIQNTPIGVLREVGAPYEYSYNDWVKRFKKIR